MASANQIFPIPIAVAGEPQILPWANTPVAANLEPPAAQIVTGWTPAPDAPDFRVENYVRNAQAKLNSRGIESALLIEYVRGIVTVNAGYVAGDVPQITIAGHACVYTVILGDTAAIIALGLIAVINSNPLTNALVFAETGGAGVVWVTWLTPGAIDTLTKINGGAGTLTITINPANNHAIIRTDANNTGLPSDPQMMDLVIGSMTLDDGNANGRKRITWRKAKAAFSAGEFTGTQNDDANVGDDSVRLGYNAKASGARGFAAGGSGSECRAADALAMMGGISNGANDIAIGVSAVSDKGAGQAAVSMGEAAQAGASSVAVGYHANAAAGGGGTAVGSTAHADGSDSVAIGINATSSADASIAIGDGAKAESANAIAIGDGIDAKTGSTAMAIGKGITTTGEGALGTGITSGTNTVQATGKGSRAHGVPHLDNGFVKSDVIASGEGAYAHGDDVLASGDFSRASGAGAIAQNRGERAHSSLSNAADATEYPGRHQDIDLILQVDSTDAATAMKFCTDKADGTGTEWTPQANRAYAVRYRIAACKGTDPSEAAIWEGTFIMAKIVAGTVDLSGVAGVIGRNIKNTDISSGTAFGPDYTMGAGVIFPGTATVKISASGGVCRFEANGIAATNVRWCLALHATQVGGV